MPIEPIELRRAMGCFATGVAVITTADADGRPRGFTANSLTSLSLDPPLILFCLALKADTLEVMEASGVFAVNILSAEQEALARQFATKGNDKFAGVRYHPSALGPPILDDALAHLECRTQQIYPGGDHRIYVGQVEAMGIREGSPLLFYQGQYNRLPSNRLPTKA